MVCEALRFWGDFHPYHKLEHWFNEALLVMGQGVMTTHWEVTWTEDVDEIDYFVHCILIFG
jgi:hypothetical protein